MGVCSSESLKIDVLGLIQKRIMSRRDRQQNATAVSESVELRPSVNRPMKPAVPREEVCCEQSLGLVY